MFYFYLFAFAVFFPLGNFSYELLKWGAFVSVFLGTLLYLWREWRFFRLETWELGFALAWLLGGFFLGAWGSFFSSFTGPQDSYSMLGILFLWGIFLLRLKGSFEAQFLKWIPWSAMLLSGSIFLQMMLQWGFFGERFHGVMGHPAWAAFYLSLCLPFLSWPFLLVASVAMFCTGTKLGILLALLFVGRVLWQKYAHSRIFYGALALLLVGTLLVFLEKDLFSLRSVFTRLEMWQLSLEFLQKHPFGTGFNSFMSSFYEIASLEIWRTESVLELRYAHNLLLDLVFALGYGAFPFMFFVGVFFLRRYRALLVRSPFGLALLLFVVFSFFQPIAFFNALFAVSAWAALEREYRSKKREKPLFVP